MDSTKKDIIKEVINQTTEKNVNRINWTKVWSSKYPILATYQQEVDVPHYAKALRELLESLKETYHYSELDAMLVLKDILAHEWKK